MIIKFYYDASDNRCINKELLEECIFEGTLREESSIIEPSILLQNYIPIRYNYAYIPDFKRYYFINNIESVRNDLWKLELKVDPLMSFKADILSLKVVVDKQSDDSNGDEYIDDSSLISDNLMFNRVYNFSNGFNDNGEYILITAG